MEGAAVLQGFSSITELPYVEKFDHFEVVESTNTYAKSLKAFPQQGMYIILSDIQTAGRGQRGNSFFSHIPGGLWVSIVCPVDDISCHFRYNRAISMAIYDILHEKAPDTCCAIKWPNDILCNQKKICGILLETSRHSKNHLIIGFGLNLNNRTCLFPPDIAAVATTLSDETGDNVSLEEILAGVVENFYRNIHLDSSLLHQLYCKRLYGVGMMIALGEQQGIFEGVLDDGRLCLKKDGMTLYFSSGPMRVIGDQPCL
ncbi:MAG: biotin--[acetyl-CoA-carboxylase] ligase [Chitinivibrionales bacterium]|nr:biotin--[acetyl-CoA-carboxylase] ligase [Chitinivibrionales bacterium]